MVEVLIVNPDTLVCHLLSAVLDDEPDIDVISFATTAKEGLSKADKARIVLVDSALPNDGALLLAEKIGKKRPHTHVLVTGVEKSSNSVLKYIEAGASGYILKEFSIEELLEQIRALPEGKAIADPEIVAQLIERLSELADLCDSAKSASERMEALSPREQEILGLISQGMTNADIGKKLHIEVGTVKNHVHNILQKLEVSNRQEASKLFKENDV